MNSSVFARVRQVIINLAGVSPDQELTAEMALFGTGLGLDSVATLELLVGLEKEFGIEISPDELVQAGAFRTVGSLVGFIEPKITAEQ